jgi:hypothetical protein
MKKYYRIEYTLNEEERSWNTPDGWTLAQSLNKLMEVNKDVKLEFNNVIVVDVKKRSTSSLYL